MDLILTLLFLCWFIFVMILIILSKKLYEHYDLIRKCKRCGSRLKIIKHGYWVNNKYEYDIYCDKCGCHLGNNFGIDEETYYVFLNKVNRMKNVVKLEEKW